MHLARLVLPALIPLLAFAALACGDDDGSDAPPDTPIAETPTPEPTPDHGDSPRVIDDIVEAVESGDLAALERLFVFQRIACTTETGQGPGGPPACRGEPDGTPVSVAPMAACEGYYVREGELMLEQMLAGDAAFYAAYEFTEGEYWTGATYAVVFSFEPSQGTGPRSFAVIASEDAVLGIFNDCGWEASRFAASARFGDVVAEPGQ